MKDLVATHVHENEGLTSSLRDWSINGPDTRVPIPVPYSSSHSHSHPQPPHTNNQTLISWSEVPPSHQSNPSKQSKMQFSSPSLYLALAALLTTTLASPVIITQRSVASEKAALEAENGKAVNPNLPNGSPIFGNGQGSCVAVEGMVVCSDSAGNPIG
ncbi:hypothetical protein BDZ45DRAFT_677392, partial [Acephala macrosclerotiorum]